MYLLDTNVVSELRKAGDGRADPNVTRWVGDQDAGSLYISALTVMELEIDVLRIERRDAEQGARLRSWLEERVLPESAGRTLPIDSAVTRRCATLHVPDQKSDRDALIIATALVHEMSVVTRNTLDFTATNVPLVDPRAAA